MMAANDAENRVRSVVGRPFAPGKSANPDGRPKENVEVKAAAREHSLRAIEVLGKWMESDNPKASIAAAVALLDRAHGKPAQSLDVHMKINTDLAARLEVASVRRKQAPLEVSRL